MADTGYLEFSYNEAEVNEITSYLTSTKNRLNEYNLTSLISHFDTCFSKNFSYNVLLMYGGNSILIFYLLFKIKYNIK